MVGEDETSPAVRVGGESPRAIKLCFHDLVRSFPDEPDDLMRDFFVTADSEAVQINGPSWRQAEVGTRRPGSVRSCSDRVAEEIRKKPAT